MKDILSVIRTCKLFSGISGEELQQILSCLDAKSETFPKDFYILCSGDSIEAFGLMLSGSAFIIQEDFWGNRNILSSIEQGQCFGESFACAPETVLNVSVVTQSAATVLFLNVKRILTTCPSSCPFHTKMIQNLLADMANKNLHMNEKVTHMGQRTTRMKVLSYLSAQARIHNSAEFCIPFTRQQLADYLSVDRSGLSLELCKMRDEGLMEFNKNHFF